MLKRHKFKIIIVLIIIIGSGYTANNLWKDYQYQQDIKLRIDDFEKIEYDSVESLVRWIDNVDYTESVYNREIGHFDTVDNYIKVLNNVVYTINEDQIIDEFYEVIYSYDFKNHRENQTWLIYDLAINNQYCHYQRVNLTTCYVSETETKSSERMVSGAYRHWLWDLQIVKVDSSSDKAYPKYYDTERSELFLEVIDNAYIISQGPNTPDYDQAMKWSYELAKSNGNKDDFETFKSSYYASMKDYNGELKILKELSLEEIIDDYDRYSNLVGDIDDEIKMRNYNNY